MQDMQFSVYGSSFYLQKPRYYYISSQLTSRVENKTIGESNDQTSYRHGTERILLGNAKSPCELADIQSHLKPDHFQEDDEIKKQDEKRQQEGLDLYEYLRQGSRKTHWKRTTFLKKKRRRGQKAEMGGNCMTPVDSNDKAFCIGIDFLAFLFTNELGASVEHGGAIGVFFHHQKLESRHKCDDNQHTF
ncbi:uncharacterized protein LOC128554642 [Mercenaria mercenaria]|uniref:uncharacterized protein LOC128554642 n=1 Tax=Mercenaria mercenaria TaxID=6596 RepID=UPI00234FAB0C|nr:uncharacterized protein LOC128554642 [Mercenaria mercenaria]